MAVSSNIVAVIVTFYPDKLEFQSLVETISPHVDAVVVVDNTPTPNLAFQSYSSRVKNLHFIMLGDNFGIAYAHNRGLEWAQHHEADYVLLLDQDSLPSASMVHKLLATMLSNDSSDLKLVAAGPTYEDPRTSIRSYFMVSKFGIPYRYKPEREKHPNHIVTVSFLISSGTLISMDAIRKLGGMRSNYFIDHVDTEWCFRMRAAGFQLVGCHDALMYHFLGDEVKKVWLFYNRNVSYHSPLRDYYMFRNTLLMFSDVEVPLIWRGFLLIRLVQFAAYFLIFAKERRQRLRLMLLGFCHGIRRISGKLDPKTGFCTPIPLTQFDPS